MRVLLVFSSSDLGGAERSLTRMAFHPTNVTYQLATLDGEGPWCDWVRSYGRTPLVFGSGMAVSMWRLVQYVRKNEIDIIYICGARGSFFLRFLRFFMLDVKLVHGVRWNPDSNMRLDRFFRTMELYTRPLIDAWFTNSVAAKRTLVSRCRVDPSKVSVIYNGLEEFPETVLPLCERPVEVLTVANLSLRKGHKEFLQVIRYVLNKVPAARFVFIGRDDLDGEIQHLIQEAGLAGVVRYEGFCENVSPWYARAQLFVLPSLWGEGCPTSILEAFAHGLPAVAYSIDGIPELVSDKDDGLLSEPGCARSLGSSIVDLLKDPSYSQLLGDNGRKKVKQHFTVGHCADQHSECFQNVVDS